MPADIVEERNPIIPFLKWAGGKRWLIARFPELLPHTFNDYYEPFLGSGAVFFYLRPARGRLSDANLELVNMYKAIKNDPQKVFRALKQYDARHDDAVYYAVRRRIPHSATRRAARTIYLNRTCWNGLYRVNRRGEFNVPRGTKSTILFETDDFQEIAKALRQVSIVCCDFEETIDAASKNDFIFADPPYTVRHNNNGFLKYNESIFTWSDQLRLYECIKRAANRGAKILLTNADHEPIKRMYRNLGFVRRLPRASVISGDSKGRRETTEIAVLINLESRNTGRGR